MPNPKSLLGELISNLKQQRDELALQIHLGKAEAQEQWDELQEQYDKLTADYEPLKNVAEETADNVISGLQLTADEIKRGFDRVGELLQEGLKDK